MIDLVSHLCLFNFSWYLEGLFIFSLSYLWYIQASIVLFLFQLCMFWLLAHFSIIKVGILTSSIFCIVTSIKV
jgi:hypothetical protein